MVKLAASTLLFAFALALGLAAESPPAAPPAQSTCPYPLPAEERFVYARKIGEKRDSVEFSTRRVDKDGAEYCELTMHSADQDGLFKLDPATLFATFSDITTRSKDATVRRVMTVLENKTAAKADELLVSGADSLGQTLRLFPWDRGRKAKLVFVGSGNSVGGGFSFELSVSGKETIIVEGRSVECWKAQLGLDGFFGGLVGKTSLWYSTGKPSYLVRSEGSSGGPGSPTSVLQLVSYGSSAAAHTGSSSASPAN